MPASDTPHILIVDDDATLRTVLAEAVSDQGWRVSVGDDVPDLERALDPGVDALLTDVLMPSGNALDGLASLRDARPDLPILVMSAHNTLSTAIKATEAGAFDYIAKPFDLDRLLELVATTLDRPALDARTDSAVPPPADQGDFGLIGRSPAMQTLYRDLGRIVPTDLTVLIRGESGTGKELIARTVHEAGPRASGPFVAVNMAALPRELIESELFGHEKGAFTGATHSRAGRFREARGGTLFLDEIGDMPLEAQTRLLRVLQEGDYRAVGASRGERADVRIVAATNANLEEAVEDGRFREDLFWRLNVIPLVVPPLRVRIGDVTELAKHFIARGRARGLAEKQFDDHALAVLNQHVWPGNVRELENVITRLMVLRPEHEIGGDAVTEILATGPQKSSASSGMAALPEASRGPAGNSLGDAIRMHLQAYFDLHGDELPPRGLYARILAEVERPLISKVLAETGGNQVKAADVLGLNRNTLRKKITELEIDPLAHRNFGGAEKK